ncbi:hypothetical protein BASA50_010410 [Batrachochytrium salamandrivorans]|uniref:Uncharacterized protein n=1 Tax=Batrachochytrium salamandrivorans TaxID=1357716 RepID=A0ABQ8EYL3_9FUNG|nr:hypothetical protein BASA50_010410 [Batrachochytrium salamandrivorans]
MMAAQAAVLSVAPATGVNLVKRAPNGDDDAEQSDMAGCDWEASPACTIANTEIAKFEGRLVSLEVQLEATLEEYKTKLHERNDVEKARLLEDHAYLRSYLEDHLVEVG